MSHHDQNPFRSVQLEQEIPYRLGGRLVEAAGGLVAEQELGLLLDRFEQAQEGQGQAVLIAGEAGIGKSRLVHRLRDQLRETVHTWLDCHTSPYTQSSALHPVIELLEQGLRLHDVDAPEEKLARLERGLADAGIELGEAVPLFASLLSLRLPERYLPPDSVGGVSASPDSGAPSGSSGSTASTPSTGTSGMSPGRDRPVAE